MKYISIRQFQQNMYQYLGELPLCIMKYNKPAFYIVKDAPTQTEHTENEGRGEPFEEKNTVNAAKAHVATDNA